MSLHEFDLITWVQTRGLSREGDVGIGDDAAVWNLGDRQVLLATDLLMEGTHFTFPEAKPAQAGRKALAVNLSDIAAMGGLPRTALVSLVLPRCRGIEFGKEVMSGLLELAAEFDIAVLGGDTNIWDGPLVINVAVTGETTENGAILRSGALPGDAIYVTGPLGGSFSGHHLDFTPRVREALKLNELATINAMIDISDGLASDLRHVLKASGVGAILVEDAIPVSAAARAISGEKSPLEHALGDGEDFELLFTVSEANIEVVEHQTEVVVYRIGTMTADLGYSLLQTGAEVPVPVPELGWKHGF